MTEIDDRALAIARGLVASGRARVRRLHDGGFILLIASEIGRGGCDHFWIRHDGEMVIHQRPDGTDEPLPCDLVDEMALLGRSPVSRGVDLDAPSATPSPAEDPSLYEDFDLPYQPPGWVNPIRLPAHVEAMIAARRRDAGR
jgi:hypothetical protein